MLFASFVNDLFLVFVLTPFFLVALARLMYDRLDADKQGQLKGAVQEKIVSTALKIIK